MDQPHSVRSWPNGGATYYYATDHPGHVVGLIDGANQMAAEYHYTPWGEPESVRGNVVQPLRFMAREYEEFSGLYQVRARWYDVQSGRFVSEDPIGLAGGINPYRYAGNDPINKVDPFGRCELWAEWITFRDGDGRVIGIQILRTYWKGEDCGDGERGGGGGGSSKPDNRPSECQAMATAAGFIARHSRSARGFIDTFAQAVAGVSGVLDLRGGRDGLPSARTGGYKLEFGGPEKGNARHFAGNVWAAAHIGVLESRGLSWLRENTIFPGSSAQDHNLSKAGHSLGWMLEREALALTDVQSWIEKTVCK